MARIKEARTKTGLAGLAKYIGFFRHNCTQNLKSFSRTSKATYFLILKSKSISNTPLRCLNFSFSIKGLSNSQVGKQLHQITFRNHDKIPNRKIKNIKHEMQNNTSLVLGIWHVAEKCIYAYFL